MDESNRRSCHRYARARTVRSLASEAPSLLVEVQLLVSRHVRSLTDTMSSESTERRRKGLGDTKILDSNLAKAGLLAGTRGPAE